MSREVERKFVLSEPPRDLTQHRSEPIAQRYLVLGPEGLEVRLRRTATATLLTVKHGVGLVRREQEMEIDPESFARLWDVCEGLVVEKDRYRVSDVGRTVEVDVYRGALDGLITAEVEFPTVEAAREYAPAGWLGREVTGDTRYSNQQLATAGLPRT